MTSADPLAATQAELEAVTREIDAVYDLWPRKKNEDDEYRGARERLLAPLRAQCVEIGYRRYAIVIATGQPGPHPEATRT